MLYEKPSDKSMPEIELALRDSAARYKFGVLHVHDLRAKLREKGVEMSTQCQVFEVCNPHQAKRVLDANPSMSSALPCRISVYEKEGRLILSTILPTAIMGMFATPELAPAAEEVEAAIKKIIDESA
jgi:uncharacterized protein (DUF302 family)